MSTKNALVAIQPGQLWGDRQAGQEGRTVRILADPPRDSDRVWVRTETPSGWSKQIDGGSHAVGRRTSIKVHTLRKNYELVPEDPPGPAPAVTSASLDVEVDTHFYCGSGCHGSRSYKFLGSEREHNVAYGVSPESVLGQLYAKGSRLRITVEVLSGEPETNECHVPHKDWIHDAHKRDDRVFLADNGYRWSWRAPDGPDGLRQLWHERRDGTRYLEQSYSAGWRREDWSDDELPERDPEVIARKYGLTLTEVTDGEADPGH